MTMYRVESAITIDGVPGEIQTEVFCPYWEDAPDTDDEDAVSAYDTEWEKRLLGKVEAKIGSPVLQILAFEPVENW